jgi:DNA-binding transcriptional LysR family regulator
MHRRHQQLNVPIEIVRTVVAVSEAGSLSKAGEIVGLTQPAVSSQMKRIESLMGGALFKKTANGSIATDLGKLVLHQARKILDANDQMLRIAGIAQGPQPLRLGLSTLFVQPFIRSQTAQTLSDIFINTDHSVAIAKGLVDGYIDIACIFENPEIESDIGPFIVNEFSDPLVWVRSKDFVLSPGTPIPVLTWPGDDWMIRSLTRQGLSYKIVFNSPVITPSLPRLKPASDSRQFRQAWSPRPSFARRIIICRFFRRSRLCCVPGATGKTTRA